MGLKQLGRWLQKKIDAVEDFIDDVEEGLEFLGQVFEVLWDYVFYEQVKELFSKLGIEGETRVYTEKISIQMFEAEDSEVIRQAQIKVITEYLKSSLPYMHNYNKHMGYAKTNMFNYYRFGATQYAFGLPDYRIYGKNLTSDPVADAILSETGLVVTVLSVERVTPVTEKKCFIYLQDAPYNYRPSVGLLSFPNDQALDRDWSIDSIVTNGPVEAPTNYSVNIGRTEVTTYVWIKGNVDSVDGGKAVYTVIASEPVPEGETLTVNLVYAGSAVPGVDYDQVLSVDITGSHYATFEVQTYRSINETKDLTVTIDSLTPTAGAADQLALAATQTSITTTLINGIEGFTPLTPGNVEVIPSLYVAKTDTITVPVIPSKDLIIAKYYETAGQASDWFYWTYDVSSGTWPNVKVDAQSVYGLSMMPTAILRKDKVNIAEGDPEYFTTLRLLSTLQIGLQQVLDSISNGEGDPDDCYINFSLSPSSTNRIVSKLLFRTFYQYHIEFGLISENNKYMAVFKEQDISNGLAWSGYDWTVDIAGSLTECAVGDYTHERIAAVGEGSSQIPSKLVMKYRKTANTYDELVIHGLSGLYTIAYAGQRQVAGKNIMDDGMTIPLSYALVDELTDAEALEVYGYILRLDFNAIVIQELEFWQTEDFAKAVKIVIKAYQIAASISSGGLLGTAVYLVSQYLLSQIFVFIVEKTGNEDLALLVTVTISIAMSGGLDSIEFGDFVNAEALLKAATDFVDNYAAALGREMESRSQEMAEFRDEYEDRMDILDRFSEDMETDLDTGFLAQLQSRENIVYKAIQNQYDYDIVYGAPDLLVSSYVETHLKKTGIV